MLAADQIQQLLLLREDDLLLVAEVAEERRAPDLGPLRDLGDRDRVEPTGCEELVRGDDDPLPRLLLLALDERKVVCHPPSIVPVPGVAFRLERRTVWYAGHSGITSEGQAHELGRSTRHRGDTGTPRLRRRPR